MDVEMSVEDSAMNLKREQVMQRMQKNKPKKNDTPAALAKAREQEIDALVEKARQETESGDVTDDTVRQLEEMLSHQTAGWASRRLQTSLNGLREVILARDNCAGGKKTTSFKFVRKPKPGSASPSQILKPTVRTGVPPIVAELDQVLSDDDVIVADGMTDVTRIYEGNDGKTAVMIKNIDNCTLTFMFKPAAVLAENVADSKLYFLPVTTSALLNNVTDSLVVVMARQLRVHNSKRTTFYTSVLDNGFVLEECKEIRLAPYRLYKDGVAVEPYSGDSWLRPVDFSHLGRGNNTNYSCIDEEEMVKHRIGQEGDVITSDKEGEDSSDGPEESDDDDNSSEDSEEDGQ